MTSLFSPASGSLKKSGVSLKQVIRSEGGVTSGFWFTVKKSSICTHIFSGVDAGASVPLGSVISMAYFKIVPVDR